MQRTDLSMIRTPETIATARRFAEWVKAQQSGPPVGFLIPDDPRARAMAEELIAEGAPIYEVGKEPWAERDENA